MKLIVIDRNDFNGHTDPEGREYFNYILAQADVPAGVEWEKTNSVKLEVESLKCVDADNNIIWNSTLFSKGGKMNDKKIYVTSECDVVPMSMKEFFDWFMDDDIDQGANNIFINRNSNLVSVYCHMVDNKYIILQDTENHTPLVVFDGLQVR